MQYYGKYRAFVANVDDPEKRGRIRVLCPKLFGDSLSRWCEPCVPFAFDHNGDYCPPKIGEFVWVEFEGGDIKFPIYTGSLWSANSIPIEELENRIISWEGVKLVFKDGSLFVNDIDLIAILSKSGGGDYTIFYDPEKKCNFYLDPESGNKVYQESVKVTTDTTLTKEGEPADAKTTGTRLKAIEDKTSTWDGKSDFDGQYSSLTGKPTIPTKLSELSGDTAHRTVSDKEKEAWSGKSDFDGSYNSLTDKPTLFSGDYNDLQNKPTIPEIPEIPEVPTSLSQLSDDATHRVVTDEEKATWNAKQGKITVSGIVKSTSSGTLSKAVPGTDYQAPIVAGLNITVSGNSISSNCATLKDIYPIGSLYITPSSLNPADTLGFGTWIDITYSTFPSSSGLHAWQRVSDSEPVVYYTEVPGASYGFALNSDGYYESQNKGVQSSAALIQVNFNAQGRAVYLECINYGEPNYDFGLISNIDETLLTTKAIDTNVIKNFKGSSSSKVQVVLISSESYGNHFIQVKFRKDESTNNGKDTLQFKVVFSDSSGAVG